MNPSQIPYDKSQPVMPAPALPQTPPMTPPTWPTHGSDMTDMSSPGSEAIMTPLEPVVGSLYPDVGLDGRMRKPSFSSTEASRKLNEAVEGNYTRSNVALPIRRHSAGIYGPVVDLADDDDELDLAQTSPPAYNASRPVQQDDAPGSPFCPVRTLSNTGIHMTSRGANLGPASYFGQPVPSSSSNKGTYAISDGAMTPSMLESGSNDGSSAPSSPLIRSTFPLQVNLGMGLNFGMKMNFGNKAKEIHSIKERELADDKLNAVQLARMEGRKSLTGFMGGGGSGVKHAGMKGSGPERKKSVGKFYRPSNSIDAPTTTAGIAAATVVRFFSRVPRKYRPLAVAALCFLVVGSLVFKWAGERAMDVERAAARRHAMHMQKAFVIPDDSGILPDHPSAHLASHDYIDPIDIAHAQAVAEAAALEPAQEFAVGVAPVEFAMNRHEELAALISFFTSTSSNALPKIDPSRPLDPQLVLDFDYNKPSGRDDMAQLEADMWSMFPVVLVGNMRDPFHREVLKILSTFKISPPPMIVEIDQRSDAEYLTPLLARLLQSDDLPQLILKGRAAGSHKEIIAQNDAGNFIPFVSASGAHIAEKKIKKKKHGLPKDAERANRERVLAPKPVMAGLEQD